MNEVSCLGCELVPKMGETSDIFHWILSCSRAEHYLAEKISPKQRACFLALKIYFKREFTDVCPFIRSYHLKTLFFFFLEGKSPTYWTEISERDILRNLLSMLAEFIQDNFCPHFFIADVNQWKLKNQEESKERRCQLNEGLKVLREAIAREKVEDLFLSPSAKMEILIEEVYQKNICSLSFPIAKMMLIASICLVISTPVIILALIISIQLFIIWSIG